MNKYAQQHESHCSLYSISCAPASYKRDKNEFSSSFLDESNLCFRLNKIRLNKCLDKKCVHLYHTSNNVHPIQNLERNKCQPYAVFRMTIFVPLCSDVLRRKIRFFYDNNPSVFQLRKISMKILGLLLNSNRFQFNDGNIAFNRSNPFPNKAL